MPTEHYRESGAERGIDASELNESAMERLDELSEANAERDPSEHAEKRAEKAREVIQEQTAEPEPEPTPAAEKETAAISRPAAFLNHHLNYSQTMDSVRRKLGPVSRSFSKVIHTPAVEKTSEALEHTVARPSVMVGTTWTALIIGALFYLTARHYGYALSGSELIFSFVVGALLGLVGEGIWLAFRRRR